MIKMAEDFDIDLLFELSSETPQQGPGLNEYTRKAFNLLKDLPQNPLILDIGCGSGRQTIELAKISGGHITALDLHKPFLDTLEENARTSGVFDNITTVQGSMMEMDFKEHYFDIIWAESSIFVMGFEKALMEWRTFLKKGGYIAVSDVCWLKTYPPEELKEFWDASYPIMKFPEENISIIKDLGYKSVNYFILPENAWLTYYEPYKTKIKVLKKKYSKLGDKKKLKGLDLFQSEIDMFNKYSDYYGYCFFIMKNE